VVIEEAEFIREAFEAERRKKTDREMEVADDLNGHGIIDSDGVPPQRK
jgi:hypothetical protein